MQFRPDNYSAVSWHDYLSEKNKCLLGVQILSWTVLSVCLCQTAISSSVFFKGVVCNVCATSSNKQRLLKLTKR